MTSFPIKVLGTVLGASLIAGVTGFVAAACGVSIGKDMEDDRRRHDSWYSPDEWTDEDVRQAARHAGQLLGRRVVAVAMGDFDHPGDESYTTYYFEGGVDLVTQHYFHEEDLPDDDASEADDHAAGEPDRALPARKLA